MQLLSQVSCPVCPAAPAAFPGFAGFWPDDAAARKLAGFGRRGPPGKAVTSCRQEGGRPLARLYDRNPENARQRPRPPSSTALFEAECTYAYSSCPAHSPSRPSTGLLPTQWKQRSQNAGDAQQSYGVAARKADSHLGLVGARRE